MQKWEYLSFGRVAGSWTDDKYDGRNVQEKLSDCGLDGWELISVCYDSSGYQFYLKRPLAARKTTTRKPKAAAKSTQK